jgi:dTDP-4-amino-4,6-dideoxygalactose transaminase
LYKGKKVGQYGTHIFSFSGTKVVTSAEGGMIASDSPEFMKKIEYMRNYGFKGDYNSRYIGLNGKISELNAALGCLTLSDVEKQIKRRNSRVALYKKNLKGVGDITFQVIPTDVRTTYKDFCILTSKRDSLADYLKKKKIMSKKYFLPLHTMDYYRDKKASLPVTESVASRALCLPLYNTMKRDDILYITKIIITFFNMNK